MWMRQKALRILQMKKRTQSGRSMVEIMGVLAIIGLLTIAGTLGIRTLALKYMAQDVADEINGMAIKNQLRSSKIKGTTQNAGPHGSALSVKEGTGDLEQFFWIEAKTGNSSAFCEELLQNETIQASFKKNKCPVRIDFYFPRNPASNPSLPTYTDGTGTHPCPSNATCSGSGFTCKDGYTKNAAGTGCFKCEEPASTCDENGNPTACMDGYYISDNNCVECQDENANTCDNDGKSLTCKGANYYPFEGVCQENKCAGVVLTSCQASCNQSTGNITNKMDGTLCETDENDYGICQSGTCSCPENATCTSSSWTCPAGYYKDTNACIACTGDREYSAGGNATSCSTCANAGKKPDTNHTNCDTDCTVGEQCGCDAGYLWNGSTCSDSSICNGHGVYYISDETGVCLCDQTYYGRDNGKLCTKTSNNICSGHGKYIRGTTIDSIACLCNEGYGYYRTTTEDCQLCSDLHRTRVLVDDTAPDYYWIPKTLKLHKCGDCVDGYAEHYSGGGVYECTENSCSTSGSCTDNSTVCPGYYCDIGRGQVYDVGEQGDYCGSDYYVPGSGSIQPLGTPVSPKSGYLVSPEGDYLTWEGAKNYCAALKTTIALRVTVNGVNYSAYNNLSDGLAQVPNGCSYSQPNNPENQCSSLQGFSAPYSSTELWLDQLCQFDCSTSGTEYCPITSNTGALNAYVAYRGYVYVDDSSASDVYSHARLLLYLLR